MSMLKSTLVKSRRIGDIPGVIHRQYVSDEYACGRCSVTYAKLADAQACAAMSVEKPKYKTGDRVTWREPAICNHQRGRQKIFRIRAKVVKVKRPEPMDEEYNNKWLGDVRYQKTHVRMLEVEFPCLCGRERSMLLYGAETEPISVLRKKPRYKKK